MTTPKHLCHRVSFEMPGLPHEVYKAVEMTFHNSLKKSSFWQKAPFNYIIFRINKAQEDNFAPVIDRLSQDLWLYCHISMDFELFQHSHSAEKTNKIGIAVLSAFSALANYYDVSKDFLDAPELSDFFISDINDYRAERTKPNSAKQPDMITIVHDNNHAPFVGKMPNNSMLFFLTTPNFVQDIDNRKEQFVGVYLFNKDGVFEKARFEKRKEENYGLINEDDEKRFQIMEEFFSSLGSPVLEDITINIFSILKFQTEAGFIFGSVYGQWFVKANPGNYMYFTAPWDGTYYASYEALKKGLEEKYWEQKGGKPEQSTDQGVLIDVTVQDETENL